MHDHDLDLIAEHASGLLAGADAARADELVASCDVCADEFHTHSQIKTLLATAPHPAMSEFERTRLRRSVLDEVAPPRGAFRPWQQRFLAAAGGIAAVAALAVGVGVLGPSGSDDGAMTVAGESADTSVAADALVPMDDGAGDEAEMGIMTEEAAQADDDFADSAGSDAPARFAGVLVDTGNEPVDLDSVLAELSAVAGSIGEPVPLDDLVAFGATCAPSLEGPILAAVLTVIDDEAVQVFLVGDPAEPGVEYLSTADCTSATP